MVLPHGFEVCQLVASREKAILNRPWVGLISGGVIGLGYVMIS